MHDTAALTGRTFFKCYAKPGDRILDVGSMDVNGTLRAYAPADSKYLGIDLAPGPGVDVALLPSERYHWPFGSEFDLVVSTSCLEHDPAFWVTISEMARVTKPGGFVYVSAPQNGPYHGYPGDCWRFFADSAAALARWTELSGYPLVLIESFEMQPINDKWVDQVMVFGKPPVARYDLIWKALGLAKPIN
jgi:SAM-dependent methyltransferase